MANPDRRIMEPILPPLSPQSRFRFARSLRLGLLLGAALALTAGQSLAAQRSAGGYYVFGDSAVEQGNLYALPGRTPPGAPYYSDGGFTRDSNGPMWVERLVPGMKPVLGASDGDRRVNFGFSGAKTGTGNIADPDATGVLAQVALFEQRVADGKLTVWPEDRFIISAGPNDVIGAMMNGDDLVAAAAEVSANLSQAAERLAAQGARTILVDDIPDFAHSPLFTTIIGGDPALRDAFDRMAASMRNAMQSDLAGLRERLPGGIQIAVIPSNDLFRHILADPAAYGFTNASDACYDDGSGALCSPTREGQNSFLFLDGLHLTERGQQWQAAFAGVFLDELSGSVNRMIGKRSDEQVEALDTDAVTGRSEMLYPGHRKAPAGLSFTGNPGIFDAADRNFQGRGALGIEARRDDGMVFALSGIYARSEGNGGKSEPADSSRFALRGSVLVPFDDTYVLVQGGVAFNRFDNAFRETGIPGYRPRSDQDGWSGFASAEIGRELELGGFTFRPYAGLSASVARLDAVTETGGGGLGMGFGDADRTLMTGRVGVDLETPSVELGGNKLAGTLGIAVAGDLLDHGNLTGRFLQTSAADIHSRLGSDRPIRLELTPGVSYGNDDWRLALTCRASFDEDHVTQSANIAFKMRF